MTASVMAIVCKITDVPEFIPPFAFAESWREFILHTPLKQYILYLRG